MTQLKPVSDKGNVTLLAKEEVDRLQGEIDTLNKTLINLKSDISDINTELSDDSITKAKGAFDSITTRIMEVTSTLSADTANLSNILSNKITATEGTISNVISETATINSILTAAKIITTQIQTNVATITELTASEIGANDVTTTRLSAGTAILDTATISDLDVETLRIATLSALESIETDYIRAIEIEADVFTVEDEKVTTSDIVEGEIGVLYNRYKAFIKDKTKDFIPVTRVSPNPVYIKVPRFSTGFYRLELRDPTATNDDTLNTSKNAEVVWSAILFNTEDTPMLLYSISRSGDIDTIYYDTAENDWYIKSYTEGNLYYSVDSAEYVRAPMTYDQLPIDITSEKVLSYTITTPHRLVVLGNHSAQYGVDIQGQLKADTVKSNGDRLIVTFWGNSWKELKRFLRANFEWNDIDEVTHYETSEVYGYIYHANLDHSIMDEAFLDYDNTEHEALEKVSWDGHNCVLSIDAGYGQDEITINDDEDEEGNPQDVLLPFIVSFETVTFAQDYMSNQEIFQGVEDDE